MILVITHQRDAHGLHMLELLRKRGQKTLCLDYSRFPSDTLLSFSVADKEMLALVSVGGEPFEASEVRCVLNRRRAEPMVPEGIRDERIREYIVKESTNFLDALPQLLPCFWLNQPDANLKAGRKPYQLIKARELGFRIPRTLVTNSPEKVKDFLANTDSAIAVKALWTPGITINDGSKQQGILFYTRRLQKEQVLERLAQVRNCPMIFQEYVEKSFELRITVVGNRVFACAIHSQNSDKTKEDWRRYDLKNTPHERFELPAVIEERCIQLVEQLGLSFGCIDMIVDTEGCYFFLEINPNGQWLWIEHLTKMPISEAIADLLESKSGQSLQQPPPPPQPR